MKLARFLLPFLAVATFVPVSVAFAEGAQNTDTGAFTSCMNSAIQAKVNAITAGSAAYGTCKANAFSITDSSAQADACYSAYMNPILAKYDSDEKACWALRPDTHLGAPNNPSASNSTSQNTGNSPSPAEQAQIAALQVQVTALQQVLAQLIAKLTMQSTASAEGTGSSTFSVGARVRATANLNIRSCASVSCDKLGTQPIGSLGTVLGGGESANDYTWWHVDWDTGPDGWSVGSYLAKAI